MSVQALESEVVMKLFRMNIMCRNTMKGVLSQLGALPLSVYLSRHGITDKTCPGLSASSQELNVEGLISQLYLVVASPSFIISLSHFSVVPRSRIS